MSTSPGKRVVDDVGTFMTAASDVVVVKSLVVDEVVVAIALTMLLSLVLLPITKISAVIMRNAFILEALLSLDYGTSIYTH
jgi:hypothetical protein